MITIGIIKEIFGTDYGAPERRVALTPEKVKSLIEKGYDVVVESGAGLFSGYPDEEYIWYGAKVFDNVDDIFINADLITKVKQLQVVEIEKIGILKSNLKENFVMSFFDESLIKIESVNILLNSSFKIISTSQESLNAMSVISGKEMVRRAIDEYQKIHNKKPEKISVMGAGNAGQAAIKAVLDDGISCEVFVRNIEKVTKVLNENNYDMRKISVRNLNEIKSNFDNIDCLISATTEREGKEDCLFSLNDLKENTVVIDLNPHEIDTFIDGIKPTLNGKFEKTEKGVYFYSIHNYPCYAEGASESFANANFPYLLSVCQKLQDCKIEEIETVKLQELLLV